MNNYCGSKAPPPGRGFGTPNYCFKKGFGAGYNASLASQQGVPSAPSAQQALSIDDLKSKGYSVNKNKNRWIVRLGKGQNRQTIGRGDTEAAGWQLARTHATR